MAERPKCLNCGKKLRQLRDYIERPARPEEVERLKRWEAEHESLREQRDLADKEDRYTLAAKIERDMAKLRKHRPYRTWQPADKPLMVIDEPLIEKFGQDGLGLFCKRACGERFGVAAARAGFRRMAK